jgi:hypothetical protein
VSANADLIEAKIVHDDHDEVGTFLIGVQGLHETHQY